MLQAKYPPIGNRGISGQGMHTGLLNSFSASPDIRPLGCYIRAMKHIDWTQCTLIETEPGKGGRPSPVLGDAAPVPGVIFYEPGAGDRMAG